MKKLSSSLQKLGLASFIFLCFLFVLPLFTHAQSTDQKTTLPIPDTKDIEGLPSCTSIFTFGNICGDVFKSSGSFSIGSFSTKTSIAYGAGDIVACRYTGGDYTCRIDSASGTTIYNGDELSGAVRNFPLTSTEADILGKDQATAIENTSLGEVAADVGDVVTGAYECATNPFDCSVRAVSLFILSISNFLLTIAGVLFNYAVVKTVFQFSSVIGNSAGILLAWGILRDIGNLVLLFGFIFMGIATILELSTYSAKKALPGLIIFAILMNFSLFVAEAVIDTSNVFASALYSQANTDPCNSIVKDASGGQTDCLVNVGIAGSIMQATGLASAFDAAFQKDPQGTDVNDNQVTVTIIMLALFSTIGALVLFAGAIMLILRAVILSFLMVLAPIGFAGMAIPPLQSLAKRWWDKLLSESFFAPVFLLLIFISLKVTEGMAGGGSRGNESLAVALTHTDTGAMGVFLIFAIVIGFLIASLVIAKNMGAAGASFATKTATGLVFGGVALGANQVFNRAGRLARTTIQDSRFAESRVGKFAAKRVFTSLENSNSDLRRIPGVAGVLGIAGAGDAAKPGNLTLQGYENLKKEYHHKEEEREDLYQEQIGKKRLESETAGPNQYSNDTLGFLAKLSTAQLEQMKGVKEGVSKLARALSPEQFEALLKSDKLTKSEKDALTEGRYDELSTAVTNGVAGPIKDLTRDMSKGDLENIPARLLQQASLLNALTDTQREDLSKSKKRTDAERTALRQTSPVFVIQDAYERAQNAAGAAPGAGARAVRAILLPGARNAGLQGLTAAQVGKLPANILRDNNLVETFTPAMLMEFSETKKFSLGDMQTIGNTARALPVGTNDKLRDYVTAGPGASIW
jgi:hypothetical protein